MSLLKAKDAILLKRAELMRISTNTGDMLSWQYRQFVDGRVSGLNLALSFIDEELSKGQFSKDK